MRLGRYGRTEDGNGAAGAGEDAHGAIVLLLQGVLDGGDEGTGTGRDHGGLDGPADSVLGVVRVVVVGHFGGRRKAMRWWWMGRKPELRGWDWLSAGEAAACWAARPTALDSATADDI